MAWDETVDLRLDAQSMTDHPQRRKKQLLACRERRISFFAKPFPVGTRACSTTWLGKGYPRRAVELLRKAVELGSEDPDTFLVLSEWSVKHDLLTAVQTMGTVPRFNVHDLRVLYRKAVELGSERWQAYYNLAADLRHEPPAKGADYLM